MNCSIENCLKLISYKTLRLCRSHYSAHRSRKTFDLKCSTEGCQRKVNNKKRQLCLPCYREWRTTAGPEKPDCIVSTCEYPLWAKGYCLAHYHQMRKYGEIRFVNPRRIVRKRNKTGERLSSAGYKIIYVPERGWLLEHRYVMEQKLGRFLLPGENIHHIDGKRANNSPENLELWIVRQPQGQRVEDILRWAREIISIYG